MDIISATVDSLGSEVTAHLQGLKRVFLRNSDTPTALTQVAHGTFRSTDFCELHSHDTMEEVFFFLRGKGVYTVGESQISLENGVFIRIPAGVHHRLEAVGEEPLEYIYFGVATA